MTTEREDWEQLTRSAGFQRLVAKAEEDWGSAQTERYEERAADNPSDADAMAKIRQIIAARKAVRMLLRWPEERLKTLTASKELAETTTGYSRQGY